MTVLTFLVVKSQHWSRTSRRLVNGVEVPGYKSVKWDASKLSTGVYFYRLQAGNYVETKKLIILR